MEHDKDFDFDLEGNRGALEGWEQGAGHDSAAVLTDFRGWETQEGCCKIQASYKSSPVEVAVEV
jgi:hypothetical protein